MREIRENIALDVPASQAERCILQCFDRYRTPEGDIEIPLHVMLAEFGIPGGVSLERLVKVHVAKRRDAQNLNDEIALQWDPGAGQPFPSFTGTLTVWSESPETSNVELRGGYEPPLGTAGKIFDDAVGRSLARHTARQFLQTLAQGAQICFQR